MSDWRKTLVWLVTSRPRSRSRLADEASAFLEGRALEQILAGGSCWSPPSWIWLNTVAHGSPQQLYEVAETRRPATGPVVGWSAARAALAHELLVRTHADPSMIGQLQREVLEPLEQRLDSVSDLTPNDLYDMAMDEMRRCDI